MTDETVEKIEQRVWIIGSRIGKTQMLSADEKRSLEEFKRLGPERFRELFQGDWEVDGLVAEKW